MTQQGDTTRLLNDPQGVNEGLRRVWDQLRRIARWRKGLGVDPQLQTDDVIHEALIKVLLRGRSREWSDKDEFFALVGCAMRQVVITFWRKRQVRRAKPFESDSDAAIDPRAPAPAERAVEDDLTAFIGEELRRFATEDRVAGDVMYLHLFGGEAGELVEMKEVAARLNMDRTEAYRARERARDHLEHIIRRLGIEMQKEEGA